MGRTEGAGADDGIARSGEPGYGMDLRGGNDLLPAHIRQNAGQTLGHHGLARAGRPHNQDVVPAGGGDLQRPLHVLLPLHIGKVRQRGGKALHCGWLSRGHCLLPPQMAQQLPHILHRVNRKPLGKGGLGGVFRRDIQLLHAGALGGQGHGQGAGHRAQRAQQGQLAEKGAVLPGLLDFPGCGQNAHEHGQVIDGARLFLISRGQVHGHAAHREAEAVVLDGGPHPLPGFLHGGIGQAHDLKAGHAVGDIHLHSHAVAAHAADAEALYAGKHSWPSCLK